MSEPDDPEDVPEERIIPTTVMSYTDEAFADVVDVLRNRDVIGPQAVVTGMTLHVEAEEPIRVTNIETETPEDNE